MRTTHSTFRLAGTTVHQITFDPTTFTDADLLWLPHHNALAHAAPKRKAEHLAGRLARRPRPAGIWLYGHTGYRQQRRAAVA